MVFSRTIIALAALSAAALLVGCGDTESDAGSTGPSPTPVPGAAVTWADGVCAASASLGESVRQMTGALPSDPSSSSTSLEQARAEVSGRVTAVRQSAAALGAALTAAPAGTDPELTAVRQELQTASERAKRAVDQLGDTAGQVSAAQTTAETAAGLVTLRAALRAAATDVGAYLDTLRGTVNSQKEAVRAAFTAAPACAAVSPSPSTSN